MKDIHVVVTQEDIDKGEREESSSCPIARAIKRVARGYRVNVDGLTARIDRAGTIIVFAMPEKAQSFVRDFDLGCPSLVEPFEFDLQESK